MANSFTCPGDPRSLARALGGNPLRDGAAVPGPGHNARDRSLRVWLDPGAPDGFRVHSFAGDDIFVCRDYIRKKLRLPAWKPQVGAPTWGCATSRNHIVHDGPRRQLEKAIWLWTQSEGSITTVDPYLREARGINLSFFPATIRLLPPRPTRHPHPAMIAAFAMADEPEPGQLTVSPNAIRGVHLTFLRSDGAGKAGTGRDKIMIGPSMGTPIVVTPTNDNLGLAITEGIEDALSVHVATGLGAWAAGSAIRMPALADAVPSYVEFVTVVADANDVGQRNADALAERLAVRGISADVTTPVAEIEVAG